MATTSVRQPGTWAVGYTYFAAFVMIAIGGFHAMQDWFRYSTTKSTFSTRNMYSNSIQPRGDGFTSSPASSLFSQGSASLAVLPGQEVSA